MKSIAVFFLTALLMSTACKPKSDVKSNDQKTPVNVNVAQVILFSNSTSSNTPGDTFEIPLRDVTVSSGIYSSVSFRFESAENESGRKLEIFLPAATKLMFSRQDRNDVTLKDVTFPYVLKGADYIPVEGALDNPAPRPQISLYVASKADKVNRIMYFDIEELTFNSFKLAELKANTDIVLKMKQSYLPDTTMPGLRAEIRFTIENAPYSIMLVD